MVVILLLAVPARTWAMTGPNSAVDLVYRSADKLGIGVNLSLHKDGYEYTAPSMRLGIASAGASFSAGYSKILPERFAFDLHAEAIRTFDASDWPSGTWAGPELSLTLLNGLSRSTTVKLSVGRLQRLGADHPTRTQFGGGIVFTF